MSANDHAAHMDGIYRYQRYIYDVTRKYFLLGRDRLIDELKIPAGGTVLEIGCGTGRNLIQVARRYPHARLYGFDISAMMLETARASITRAGLADRITVAQGDATAFDTQAMFAVPAFDRVFISYSLSMIPPWTAVLDPAIGAVKRGGSLHVVDFGQQEGMPVSFKRALFAWLDTFTVYPRAELEDELMSAAQRAGAVARVRKILRGYAQLAVVTR